MSDNTKIEWTDATWSSTLGCTKVSPGCDNCYAMRTVHRMSFNPNEKVSAAAEGLTAYRPGVGPVWTNLVRTLPDRLDLPLRWRKPRRIFVDSQSDLFHEGVPDDFIVRVFAVMLLARQHTFQVLTKRHGRLRSLLNTDWFMPFVAAAACELNGESCVLPPWPLRNVWLGVSVEDQKRADIRIPALLDTPAAVRFLSCEPLLGPIDLSCWIDTLLICGCGSNPIPGNDPFGCSAACMQHEPSGIDWVIVGGESGPGARPMHPDWARSLRDQCTAAGIPFHFKQWGEWGPAPWSVRVDPAVVRNGSREEFRAAQLEAEARGATHYLQPWGHLYEPPHRTWSCERDPEGEYPGAIRRWGKKAAGRELDGRTWDEFPEVAHA